MSKLSNKYKQLNQDAKHQNSSSFMDENKRFLDSLEDLTPSQYQQRASKKQSLKHFHTNGVPEQKT